MSVSFYVQNKKKFLGYEPVLNVETALSLLDKELYSYNTGNMILTICCYLQFLIINVY